MKSNKLITRYKNMDVVESPHGELLLKLDLKTFSFYMMDNFCDEVKSNIMEELYHEDIFDSYDLNEYLSENENTYLFILVNEFCKDWHKIEEML